MKTRSLPLKFITICAVSMLSIKAGAQILAAGETVTMYVCSDGTVRSWGGNSTDSLLGNGNGGTSNLPVPVSVLTNVTSVAGGLYHGLAIKSDSTVWAWGQNYAGEYGSGDNSLSSVPVQTDYTGIAAVAGGGSFTIALKGDGTVWASGWNSFGQLGNGNHTDMNVPVQVTGLSNIIAVSAGHSHALALKSDSTVWGWGRNNNGQLGHGGINTDTFFAVQIPSLSGVTAISAGGYFSMALKSDGTVWTWGNNLYGQLGDGSTNPSTVPIQANITGVSAIEAGGYYSLALKTDGTVWAWGGNSYGQIGNGTTTDSYVPLQTSSLSGITKIANGWAFSLALKNDGTIWGFGTGGYGQLGNGAAAHSSVPVQATAPCGPTSVSKVEKQANVSVFPNPSNGKFTFESNGTAVLNLEIVNLLGKKVYTASNVANGKEIDISNLAKGVYFLKANDGLKYHTTKIVIE